MINEEAVALCRDRGNFDEKCEPTDTQEHGYQMQAVKPRKGREISP